MPIVGFEFDKITVDKTSSKIGKCNISTNVNIKDVQKSPLQLGSATQEGVKFIFEYNSIYEPKIANITLIGSILYLVDPEKVKDILDSWKKDKKVKKDVMAGILNQIFTKCNIQSLILSNTVNLPPPIPMPKVTN